MSGFSLRSFLNIDDVGNQDQKPEVRDGATLSKIIVSFSSQCNAGWRMSVANISSSQIGQVMYGVVKAPTEPMHLEGVLFQAVQLKDEQNIGNPHSYIPSGYWKRRN